MLGKGEEHNNKREMAIEENRWEGKKLFVRAALLNEKRIEGNCDDHNYEMH